MLKFLKADFGAGRIMPCTLGQALTCFLLFSLALLSFAGARTSMAMHEYSLIHVPQDYSTIQKAIDAATTGDIIYVSPGIYPESLTVYKAGLWVVGENRASTVIDLHDADGIRITAGNTCITGFTIRGSMHPYSMYLESSGNTVLDNVIESNVGGIYCGIEEDGTSVFNNVIVRNEFRNNSQISVRLGYACQSVISDNDFSGNYWGIALFDGSSDNVISNNRLYGTRSVCITMRYCPRNVVSNNYVDSGTTGIYIDVDSNDTIVSGNVLTNVRGLWGVIYVFRSGNITVKDNRLFNNSAGIYLDRSGRVFVSNNTMDGNDEGLGVNGEHLSEFMHFIDSSNKIDGKPVYYAVNGDNLSIDSNLFPELGFLGIVNSSSVAVRDIRVSGNRHGILLAYTKNSKIENVTAIDNNRGMDFYQSSNNLITGSSLLNNKYGVLLQGESRDTFYKNNFINNSNNAYCEMNGSTWDNGAEGNYWYNYNGKDEDLNGIGDAAHVINAGNQDNFPLMNQSSPIKDFYCGTWDQVSYYANVRSNSTVASFSFEPDLKRLSFNVTGPSGSAGFCRVTFPSALLGGNFTIRVGATTVTPSVTSNGTHTILFFIYSHSTQNVKVNATTAIPEFNSITPYYLAFLLFLPFSLLMLLVKEAKKPSR